MRLRPSARAFAIGPPAPLDRARSCRRLREPDAVRIHPRARLEAHPFADRVPVQRDRDVGVDPGRVREAQRVADATPEVGGRRGARARRQLLAGDDRAPQPEPRDARTGLDPVPAHDPHVVRAPVSDVGAADEHRAADRPRREAGGASATMPTEPLVSTSSLRSRNTVARAISRSSASSSAASSHCTLRPGRIVRTRIVSGSSGTGRSNSTVMRATKPAGPGSCDSHTCANSALGAPPCIARGSHGPRVSGVGT